MPVAGGGFEPRYNAQAAVAEGSTLMAMVDVTQAPASTLETANACLALIPAEKEL